MRLGMSMSMIAASGLATVALSSPALFGYTPSGIVYSRHGGLYSSSFTPASLKPAYTRTIVYGPGGNNASDGLTFATRVRSIKQAISKANAFTAEVVRIVGYGGDYLKSNAPGGVADSWDSFNPTVSCVFESGDGIPVYNIQNVTMLQSWSLFGSNVYRIPYTTENPTRVVIDRAKLDELGMASRLPVVLSPASTSDPTPEINAAAALYGYGATWIDTTNKFIYAQRADNSAPDANIIVLSGTSGAVISNTSGASLTFWMEKMRHWAPTPFKLTAASGVTPTVVGDDCDFNFSNAADGCGLTSGGILAYWNNCRARWNERDGFNYHGVAADAFLAATSVKGHEFNCDGSHNGWDVTGTNNGSTAHDGCAVVRLGGRYTDNQDRPVDDINNARSWNMGGMAGSRRGLAGGESSAAWVAGFASQTYAARMFVDGVQTALNAGQYDLAAYAGCTLYKAAGLPALREFAGGGTYSTYTP